MAIDPEVQALASQIAELEDQVRALATARQLSRSTVPVGDGQGGRVAMPVPDALEKGVVAGVEVGRVREALAEAREQLEAAQAELAEKLGDADQQIEDARDRLEQAERELQATIVSSLDEYTVTTSQTVPPGPDAVWSSDTPDWTPGTEFVWRRVRNQHVDGSVTHGAPVPITGADGTPGEDAVLLRVSSTRGTSFKNNAISTVLTVTVFKGARQITNVTDLWAEFGSAAYLEWWWRRSDDSEFGVISSADPRLSQAGFALTVSPSDVDEQTVFQCILHTS